MKLLGAICLLLVAAAFAAPVAQAPETPLAQLGQPEQPPAGDIRFQTIDIYIDPAENPLAAYQIQVRTTAAKAKVVGIEGGDHPAFAEPPYYDPAALHEDQLTERIILAAFSTGADLPSGRTRVARIHVQVSGEAEYLSDLQAAGSADGRRIEATLQLVPVQ